MSSALPVPAQAPVVQIDKLWSVFRTGGVDAVAALASLTM